jgi:hypothetical protein
MHSLSGSPTPRSEVTPTCPYCQNPIPATDIPSITTLAQDHGLPVGLCLRCTLHELERLDLTLDPSATFHDCPPLNTNVLPLPSTHDSQEGG